MLMFYLAMLDTPEQKSKFQMIYETILGKSCKRRILLQEIIWMQRILPKTFF